MQRALILAALLALSTVAAIAAPNDVLLPQQNATGTAPKTQRLPAPEQIDTWAAFGRQLLAPIAQGRATLTLAADLTLNDDPADVSVPGVGAALLYLNPNGANRTITLPTVAATNFRRLIVNTGSASADTLTIGTLVLNAGETAECIPGASAWTVLGGGPGDQFGTFAAPITTNPYALAFSDPSFVLFYGATGTVNLPAAAGYAGRGGVVYNTGAFTITIDPNGSEIVVRDGTAQTGGVSFTLSSGAGNFVVIYSDGSRWITFGYKGTIGVGT